MNKKAFIKRVMALALSLIMVLGLMPMTAFADGEFTFPSKSQSGNNNSTLLYYLTDENAGDVNVGIEPQDYVFFTLTVDDGWYFEKWETKFEGYKDIPIISDPKVEGSNPVGNKGHYTFYTHERTNPLTYEAGDKNPHLAISQGTGLYGLHTITAVLKPIVTVNDGEGVSSTLTTNNPTKLSDNQTAVRYKDDVTIKYEVDEKYVVTTVNASGTKTINVDKANNKVVLVGTEKPTSVGIHTRLKQQKVKFNANDGSGTMATQIFEHSVAQALTANTFTRTGYTFAGWNTKANGTGTGYSNEQSVSFTPANDGDSITLYAQWTQCTDHNWVNGECTKCGALCSHSGGNTTCTEKAICDICGEQYGELAKHNLVYNGSNNRIVETCTAGCGHTATADLVRDENMSTVYNGDEIKALKVNYSDNWQGGNLNIVYSNNVYVGTASGTISIDGATATQTFEITAATMTNVSAQGYSGTYDGEAHGITVNAPAGATISYKVGDGEYKSENPTFKDVGTYTVAYKVSMANHNDVVGTAEVNITKAPLTVTANDHSIKYGEDPANNGVICSGFVSNETDAVLSGTLAYDYTYTKGDNVGTYEITPKGLTSNNYEITFVKGRLSVEKADATCTAPTANNLTYTGAMQELVTAGTVVGGKMEFSLNKEGGYSDTLSAKNAGIYTVWYRVVGDENHNNTAPASITVEIKKATPDLGVISAEGVVTDTTKPENVVLVRTNNAVPGKLRIVKFVGEFMQANRSSYDWEFVPDDMENYYVVNGSVDIDVLDTVAPTANISIDEHKWTVWDTITFGLFYNESKEVTITAADNENGSGIKDILYFVSDKKLSEDNLTAVEWKSYTEAFDIDPDGKYVVYAKITDNDGNAVIINSDGVVLDKTQAVAEGLTNGGTYYGQLEFTVKDELAGVKSVVIDGNDKTNSEGQYVINGDNAEHTVVVTDNAGNATEYKVTVYKNYTVTYKADGETVSTETVGHGKDATLPAVPAKDGHVGKWDGDGKNITGDTAISAVYTAIPAVKPDEVKPEDKTELEDAKKQLEEMLDDDSYTEDDKKDIQDAIDNIDDALDVIGNVDEVEELIGKLPESITKNDEDAIKAADDAYDALTDYEKSLVDEDAKKALDDAKAALAELNKPADPNSPQTGDNSHMALWFALLFISGGAVIALTVYDRKLKKSR